MNNLSTRILIKRKKSLRAVLWMPRFKKWFWAYLLLLPILALYFIFFVFPFLYTVYLSFMQWNFVSPDKQFVGLNNYMDVFQDPIFWVSLKNTLIYTLGTVFPSVLIGLILAILVEAVGKWKEMYRFLFFIPVVASISVTSIVWALLFNPLDGWIAKVFKLFGQHGPNWLNDPKLAMCALIIVGVWKALGYNMVLYIAGLKSIDVALYEAARVDGASRFQQFRSITLPLLSPVTLFVIIVSIIGSFQGFGAIHIMTSGGPNNSTNMLIYQVWQEAFKFFDIGKASALSMVLFVLVLGITILQFQMTKSRLHYQ